MLTGLLSSLALSLALTLAIELGFALICGKRRYDILLVTLVNVVTNPPVVLIYSLLRRVTPIPGIWIALPLELAAVAAEALMYKRFAENVKRPLLFSLSANALSYGLGLIINMLF